MTPCLQMSGLKALLKRQAAAAGYGVAKAFLRAQAMLFGGYKDALQDTKVTLDIPSSYSSSTRSNVFSGRRSSQISVLLQLP